MRRRRHGASCKAARAGKAGTRGRAEVASLTPRVRAEEIAVAVTVASAARVVSRTAPLVVCTTTRTGAPTASMK